MINADWAETGLGWAWVRAGPRLGWAGPAQTCVKTWRCHITAGSQIRPRVHRLGPRWTHGCWSTDPWFGLHGPRPSSFSLPLVYMHPAQAVDASPPQLLIYLPMVVVSPVARPRVHTVQLLGLYARASTAQGTLAVTMESFIVCNKVGRGGDARIAVVPRCTVMLAWCSPIGGSQGALSLLAHAWFTS
jgi:hypothetical protein